VKVSILGGILVTSAIFGLLGVVVAMVGAAIGMLIRVSRRLERIEAFLTELDRSIS